MDKKEFIILESKIDKTLMNDIKMIYINFILILFIENAMLTIKLSTDKRIIKNILLNIIFTYDIYMK